MELVKNAVRLDFKSKENVPVRDKKETQRLRKAGHMKMEAETGGMWPRVRECPEMLGAGRGRKYPSLDPLEGAQPCPHLDFGIQTSRIAREGMN